MKMYFVCENQGPGWFYSYGILDNGFCFGQHVCSHPDFARGDLYFTRINRIAALRELFGVDPKTIETETIVVNSKADIPSWWAEHDKLQESLSPIYDKYNLLIKAFDSTKEISKASPDSESVEVNNG